MSFVVEFRNGGFLGEPHDRSVDRSKALRFAYRKDAERVASRYLLAGAVVLDACDGDVTEMRKWLELILSWTRNPDPNNFDKGAVESACVQALKVKP
jgi:hypothetical protein